MARTTGVGYVQSDPLGTLILFGVTYASYFILRYGGLWTENDTSVFTKVSELAVNSGNAMSTYYSHGFGYTEWLGSLSLLTGLPVQTANTLIAPFVGILLLMIPAYACYRSVLKEQRMAMLATLLLLGVPELMFSSLRGNHEKLNIVFFFVSLLGLLKAFQAARRGNVKETAVWTILYYVMVYGNASVNDYFASTMTFANIPTLFLLQLFTRKTERNFTRKIALSIGISFLVVMLVMFYLFPAAGNDFSLLTSAVQKVRSLFMTMQPSSNPYTTVTQAWAGQTASRLMSLFRDSLFGFSFLVMVIQLWQLWIRKRKFELEHLFLLSLYLSFGLIIAISVPVDMVGLGAGSNLEVRNYTYFTILATPMIAWGISRFVDRMRRRWMVSIVSWALTPLIVILVLVGVTKTTLDPVVSNNWILYSLGEKVAIEDFMNLSPAGMLWTGPDNRLTNLAETMPTTSQQNTNVVGFDMNSRPQITDVLWSKEINAYMTDRHNPEPDLYTQDLVYDNGDAQIYHKRPQSPFQH